MVEEDIVMHNLKLARKYAENKSDKYTEEHSLAIIAIYINEAIKQYQYHLRKDVENVFKDT